jgi:hypothetical protein
VSWWRYYQAEPWGDERADIRQEIGRLRTITDDDDPRRPGWQYPYASLESGAAELTPEQMREAGAKAIEAVRLARQQARKETP